MEIRRAVFMKKRMDNVLLIFLVLMIGSCDILFPKGPDDNKVIGDIRTYLINDYPRCGLAAIYGVKTKREVNDVKIVGRQRKDNVVKVQAIAKGVDHTGPCQGGGPHTWEVEISYEKFGNDWRLVQYGFDYRTKK
jgi:hypothetical protein